MNSKILPFVVNAKADCQRRYRVYVSNHMQLHSQPERVLCDLKLICPDLQDNAVALLRAGHKLNVREGRFEALSPLAARLYSLGFQIELVALD
jgi:hypothetical protein